MEKWEIGRRRKSGLPGCVSVSLDGLAGSDSVTPMPKKNVLTVKQLHDDTGPSVRRAGASRRPVPITDRGELVAVLANPSLVRPVPRRRILLPEYEALMAQAPRADIQAALDEVRGER